MSVTDIYLRQGADVLVPGLSSSDILLWPVGPDGGGPPPFISAQGTVTSTALLSAVEAYLDTGDTYSVAGISAAEELADRGHVVTTALLSGEGFLEGTAGGLLPVGRPRDAIRVPRTVYAFRHQVYSGIESDALLFIHGFDPLNTSIIRVEEVQPMFGIR